MQRCFLNVWLPKIIPNIPAESGYRTRLCDIVIASAQHEAGILRTFSRFLENPIVIHAVLAAFAQAQKSDGTFVLSVDLDISMFAQVLSVHRGHELITILVLRLLHAMLTASVPSKILREKTWTKVQQLRNELVPHIIAEISLSSRADLVVLASQVLNELIDGGNRLYITFHLHC